MAETRKRRYDGYIIQRRVAESILLEMIQNLCATIPP